MKSQNTVNNFGKRLAQIRKDRGLTQRQLAKNINVSERVIAYYEAETKYPPAHLIIPLAKALRVSSDELLGIKIAKLVFDPQKAALWRRFKKVDVLPKRSQQALFQVLDGLLEKHLSKLK